MHKTISLGLIIVSVIMMIIGINLEVKGQDNVEISKKLILSKPFYFASASFLAALGVWFKICSKPM